MLRGAAGTFFPVPALCAGTNVKYHGVRGNIELDFKEIRQEPGSEKSHGKNTDSVPNHLDGHNLDHLRGWASTIYSPDCVQSRHWFNVLSRHAGLPENQTASCMASAMAVQT